MIVFLLFLVLELGRGGGGGRLRPLWDTGEGGAQGPVLLGQAGRGGTVSAPHSPQLRPQGWPGPSGPLQLLGPPVGGAFLPSSQFSSFLRGMTPKDLVQGSPPILVEAAFPASSEVPGPSVPLSGKPHHFPPSARPCRGLGSWSCCLCLWGPAQGSSQAMFVE